MVFIVGISIFFASLIVSKGFFTSGIRHEGSKSLNTSREDLISGSVKIFEGKRKRYELVEFMDYQCPFCAGSRPKLEAIAKENSDVTIYSRQFPLKSHPHSKSLALLAYALEMKGQLKTNNDKIFALGAKYSETRANELAKTFGVENYLQNSLAQMRVKQDIELASRIGVKGTPTYVLIEPSGQAYVLASLDHAMF